MSSEDMMIDTSTFDFASIIDSPDIKVVTKEVEGKEAPAATEPSDLDGTSDLVIDEDADNEEVEETEDGATEETEEGDAEEADEGEVDYEGYEITLPSGEDVKLVELVQGYKDNQQLQAERDEFEQIKETFLEKTQDLAKQFELATLECDMAIKDYDDFDWNSYKREDPAGYVENREFLDRFIERRKEIFAAQEKMAKEKADAEQRQYQEDAIAANKILTRDIPGWNPKLYEELMNYAIANGVAKDDIEACIDPAQFKILHKAMVAELGKKTVTAKVKKVGGINKVVNSKGKAPNASKQIPDGVDIVDPSWLK